MTKVKVPARKAEVTATSSQKNETTDSSLPVWKDKFGRVQSAMWNHLQEDGKTRQTISISRSYQDENKKWHNVHYFDSNDIKDIRAACDQAEEQILKLNTMTQEVGED
jgi:hypothetical protein